jgi:hypothetical protein
MFAPRIHPPGSVSVNLFHATGQFINPSFIQLCSGSFADLSNRISVVHCLLFELVVLIVVFLLRHIGVEGGYDNKYFGFDLLFVLLSRIAVITHPDLPGKVDKVPGQKLELARMGRFVVQLVLYLSHRFLDPVVRNAHFFEWCPLRHD